MLILTTPNLTVESLIHRSIIRRRSFYSYSQKSCCTQAIKSVISKKSGKLSTMIDAKRISQIVISTKSKLMAVASVELWSSNTPWTSFATELFCNNIIKQSYNYKHNSRTIEALFCKSKKACLEAYRNFNTCTYIN